MWETQETNVQATPQHTEHGIVNIVKLPSEGEAPADALGDVTQKVHGRNEKGVEHRKSIA